MAAKNPQFDYSLCMACGLCQSACPLSCIDLSKTDVDVYKKAYPVLTLISDCTGCSICQKTCPVDAIQMMEVNQVADQEKQPVN